VIVYGGSGGTGLFFFLLMFVLFFVVVPAFFLRSARRSFEGMQAPYGHGAGRYPQQYPPQPVEPGSPQPVVAADVQSVRDRLGHDVRSLQPGNDPVARQAMADASERYATCSSLLERATSQDQLRTAWLAAAEGLHATRLVRERLGLDPGPAPALPPSGGAQLRQAGTVTVGGRPYAGAPTYQPGYSHWFPGGYHDGRYVPGGWYAEPFWPGSLVLGALSGYALGSLLTAGMYGGMLGGYGDFTDAGWDGGAGVGDWGGDGGWDGGGGWGGGGWDGGGGDFGGDVGGGGDW
jgi:hypothetical protein